MLIPDSMNSAAAAVCLDMIREPNSNGITSQIIAGATVISFASDGVGTSAGGIALAKICLGGQGSIDLLDKTVAGRRLVRVEIDCPLAACIGCQYAGWPLSAGKYFAMASGPIRLLRGKEVVLEEYRLAQTDKVGVVVLETSKLPDESVIEVISKESGLPPSELMVCVARTSSVPGSLQVVARSVETALHKLHELKFDLSTVTHGIGTATLPPSTEDDLVALGWTNDSVLYGGQVELLVDTEDGEIAAIIEKTPSCHSDEFGTPFIDLFKHYEYDFYKIDPMLFSPAMITIRNQRTGSVFSAGQVRGDILQKSFGTG